MIPQRREKGLGPTDPWISTGRFKIIDRTASSLKLEGPQSPISGLLIRKEVYILPDGAVQLKAEAVNIRSSNVSWGLWSITRLAGAVRCYAPSASCRLRMYAPAPESVQALQYDIIDGFFTFRAPEVFDGRDYQMKAFLNSPKGLLCAFGSDFMFMKTFNVASPHETHPNQAPLEIFQKISEDASANVLELEFHGPYKTLAPGESLLVNETWRLIHYDGAKNTKANLEFLRPIQWVTP